MMDQTQATSQPGLVTELLKRHLAEGSKPHVKVKVKMQMPASKHGADCQCSDCKGAANQWSS